MVKLFLVVHLVLLAHLVFVVHLLSDEHRCTGRGGRGGLQLPPPSPKVWATQIFWAAREVSILFNYFKDLNINLESA